jgi:hypothetical protein
VPTPTDLRKQFISAFNRLARHRDRYDVLSDFLEMAFCTIRKATLPPGPAADAIEARYMAVVGRNKPEDVRAIPELFGLAAMAIHDGGCDFLGQVTVELELRNKQMGQFFTPYDVSRMIAEMTFESVGGVIERQGFVTVQEPACGAGGMIIAAADALASNGFDTGRHLYVDGTDLSAMCFKMSYIQASLRGIPATIRRGNTLSLEVFDHAVTPAFFSFYAIHKDRFDAWRQGTHAETNAPDTNAPEPAPGSGPVRTVAPAVQVRRPTTKPQQLNLFD